MSSGTKISKTNRNENLAVVELTKELLQYGDYKETWLISFPRYELIQTSKLEGILRLAAALKGNPVILSERTKSICRLLQQYSGVKLAFIQTLEDFTDYYDCSYIIYEGNIIDTGLPSIQSGWMVSKSTDYRLVDSMNQLIDSVYVIRMRKIQSEMKQRQNFRIALRKSNSGNLLSLVDMFSIWIVWLFGCVVASTFMACEVMFQRVCIWNLI